LADGAASRGRATPEGDDRQATGHQPEVRVPHPKLDPENPTEVLSVRLSRRDYERVRELARREDRPVTAQARRLIKEALHLSARRPHTPDEDR
jgi:hypothetical protein